MLLSCMQPMSARKINQVQLISSYLKLLVNNLVINDENDDKQIKLDDEIRTKTDEIYIANINMPCNGKK